jgi:hypothetical protein
MSKSALKSSKAYRLEQERSQLDLAHTPWEHNWEEDRQGAGKTVEEYVTAAEQLSSLLVPRVKQLVEQAEQAAGIPASGVGIMDQNIVKSLKSATRKLSDENVRGDPSRIGDYLRTKIVVPSGKDAIRLITALREEALTSPNTTSYRDNFRRPCPEGGHVGFKFHMLIASGDKSIKAEVQIAHEDMERGPRAEAVHALRRSERNLSPGVKGERAIKLTEHWARNLRQVYDATQELRRKLNEEIIRESGLYVLLDPDLRRRYEFNKEGLPEPVIQESIVQTLAKKGWRMVGSALEDAAKILPPRSAFGEALDKLISQSKSSPDLVNRSFH